MKTIVYAKFGGQTKCIMGNWIIDIEDNTWFLGDMKFIFECSNR